jgi:signal transduction histidine kinase
MALPLSDNGGPGEPVSQARGTDPGTLGRPSPAVSILLVDDEARNLDVLESILGTIDYNLVRARTADEALLALLGGEFAAIVLDIRMPGISGIELAQMIKQRKRTRDIPILFLTAHLSEERDVLLGYDVGAVDYLTKPVNPDILRSKIAVFADLFRKTRALAAANEALEKEVAERQRAEEALRQANEELEARVQERTADLLRMNQALRENDDRLQAAFEEKRSLLESERAARSEVERASRLKDEFLAVVSHELRTPLNAILGWAHILTEGGSHRPEMMSQGLQAIVRNARTQALLIEDLLDMSRIVSGKMRLRLQTLDLAEIAASAVGTIMPAAQAKGVQVETVVHAAPWVRGDPERLQQILLNLLSNAVKFTPEGGQVRVSVSGEEPHAEVVVRDTGQGIQAQFLPYVFDPFRQADSSTTRRHGGLGLGLAVVSHLVELHGGSVHVESLGEGLGASFFVRLPCVGFADASGDFTAYVAGQEAFDGVEPQEPAELGGVRLLVVEDEPDTRSAITRFLEDYGAQDGYELIRALRHHETASGARHLPAVAVTAFTQDEDRLRVLREGYSEYVPKPVNTARLISVLRQLAGKNGSGAAA